MASKCHKCDCDINVKEVISCSECENDFHSGCTRIMTVDNLKKMSSAARLCWKCDECSVSPGKVTVKQTSEQGAQHGDILAAINSFRQANEVKWEASFTRFDKLESELSNIKGDINNIKTQISDIKHENTLMGEDVKLLKKENIEFKSNIDKLNNEINELQQYSRINNMIITGVPYSDAENVYDVLASIAGALGVKLYPAEIDVAHRLAPRRGDNRPPPIIVKFISRTVKWSWMDARKKKRNLSARDLHVGFPDQQIYLNDHLTPNTRDVFNKAREMVKQQQMAAAWVTDGRVMVKKKETDRAVRVRNLADLRGPSQALTADQQQQSSSQPRKK